MTAKRADKAKNIDKVAAALVKNPLASEREIARDVNIGNGTAHRALKELERTGAALKDSRIISLTDEDMKIQELIQSRKLKKLKETPDKISDGDLNNWDRHSMTRYTTFRGDITDNKGGLKESVIDMDQKQRIYEQLKKDIKWDN